MTTGITPASQSQYEGYQGTELPPGTVVSCGSQFEIVQRLGEGGMSKVYKAFDRLMNRYVALKVMKNDVPDWAHRHFRREARMCASFMHNNLVHVMQVGTTEEFDLLWFAMEYLRGKDVGWFVDSGTSMSIPVICEIFSQVLDALRYVHLRRIVHCDIKPSNIFVTRDSHDPLLRVVKLLDFGVARDLSDLSSHSTGHVMGDPRYIAPEQTIPGNYIDHRADIYALGMTFFELVTGGRHPFEDLFDQHPRKLLVAHRERDPLPVSHFLSDSVPAAKARAIDAFFEKSCGKQAHARFADAAQMKEALGELAKFGVMITQVLGGDDPAAIVRAAQVLRGGGLVAFPTETVYGLGADALSAVAVAKIFAAKGRPADNPLIVHVADVAAARELVREFPALAERAAAALWPGPLTIVLARGEVVPDITTAGQATVAIRVPAHPVALALLRACGRPLAAPSANRSGRPSPTLAEHVRDDLDGRVELILDGGPTLHGLESSVLDLSRGRPMLLRRGAVTIEALRALLGEVDTLDEGDAGALARSPGLRHRHYAPRARVELVEEGEGERAVERALAAGERVGLVCRREVVTQALVLRLPDELAGFGRELFAGLRTLDAAGVDRIVIEAVPEVGVGAAIMDRLRRAAAGS